MIGICSSCKAQYTTIDEDVRHQIDCPPRPKVTPSQAVEEHMAHLREIDRASKARVRARKESPC